MDELVRMTVHDIEDLESKLLISIPDSKTNKPRSFVINQIYLNVYRKYVSLRPENMNSDRFFFKYQSGKGCRQVVGIHQFRKMPKIVATYLNLVNPTEYTGHCFRRSSATILVDSGADITSLKRHGGWKSSNVAEGYIEESLNNKVEVANKIFTVQNIQQNDPTTLHVVQNVSHSSKSVPPMFNNCTNCQITVNITN